MVQGKGLEPLYVSSETGKYLYKNRSPVWIESVPPWPRRNATPHQTHELTNELFIATSLISENVPEAHTPNPNKISTFASILTLSPKLKFFNIFDLLY